MVQTKYQVDPIGFGRKLQEEHPQLWESMKSEWNRVYPQINVEVVSKVRLENVGSILSPIGRKTEELVH